MLPKNAPKSMFFKKLPFWGKKCILPKKDNFPKNMDFGAFFGNIHIINALKFQAKGAEARICLK